MRASQYGSRLKSLVAYKGSLRTIVLLEDSQESFDVFVLGVLLGLALVLVPGFPLVLAGEVCRSSMFDHQSEYQEINITASRCIEDGLPS